MLCQLVLNHADDSYSLLSVDGWGWVGLGCFGGLSVGGLSCFLFNGAVLGRGFIGAVSLCWGFWIGCLFLAGSIGRFAVDVFKGGSETGGDTVGHGEKLVLKDGVVVWDHSSCGRCCFQGLYCLGEFKESIFEHGYFSL